MGTDDQAPETYAIIGAALAVHNELGPGFLEAVYQDALEVEFRQRGISYAREAEIGITYKGQNLPSTYRADYICFDEVLIELKAIKTFTVIEDAQVLNYLRATKLNRALLINFGGPRLQHKRFVN